MARQGINTGTSPNSGTGDTLLEGGVKINDNFIELYNLCGNGLVLAPGIVTSILAGTGITVDQSTGQVTITGLGGTETVITDNLTVLGISTLSGDVIVGVNTSNIFEINSTVKGNLIPTQNQTFNLGTIGFKWNNLFANYTNLQEVDVGSQIQLNAGNSGIITASGFSGDGSQLTGIIASGSGIGVEDSGVAVGTATTIDFSTNLSVSTLSAGIVTVTSGVTTTDITGTFLEFDGSQQTQAIRASGAVNKKFAIEVGASKTEATIVGRFEPNKLTLPSGDLACRDVIGTGGTFNGTTNFNTANVGILTGAREGLVYKLSAGNGLTFEGSIHSHIGGTVGNEWHTSSGTLGVDATVLQTTGSQIILGDKTYTGITTNNKSLQTLESVNALISGIAGTAHINAQTLNVVGVSTFNDDVSVGVNTNDTLTLNSYISGNLIPSTNQGFNLGNNNNKWNNLIANNGTLSVLSLGNNKIKINAGNTGVITARGFEVVDSSSVGITTLSTGGIVSSGIITASKSYIAQFITQNYIRSWPYANWSNSQDGVTLSSIGRPLIIQAGGATTTRSYFSLNNGAGAYIGGGIGSTEGVNIESGDGDVNVTGDVKITGGVNVSGIVTANNFAGDINSGISTLGDANASALTVSGITTIDSGGIIVSGVVTATDFEGNLTGNASQSTVALNAINAFNVNSAANLDVNALSTGIGTFTGGVNVTGAAVTINNTGVDVTGVVTATSFVGDGSNLTNIATNSSGTWLADFRGGTSEPGTRVTATGYWNRIGNNVIATLNTGSLNFSGYAGPVTVEGLPVTSNTNADFLGAVHTDGAFGTGFNDGIDAYLPGNSTTLSFKAQEVSTVVEWDTVTNKNIIITISYFV